MKDIYDLEAVLGALTDMVELKKLKTFKQIFAFVDRMPFAERAGIKLRRMHYLVNRPWSMTGHELDRIAKAAKLSRDIIIALSESQRKSTEIPKKPNG